MSLPSLADTFKSLKWKKCKQIPVQLNDAQAVSLRGSIYVGGDVVFTEDDTRDALTKIYEYTPSTDVWDTIDTPVYFFALAVYRSQLVLVGGVEGIHVDHQWQPCTNQVWMWSTEQIEKMWENLPPMKTKRQFASAVSHGEYLLVAGGEDEESIDNVLRVIEVYNGHFWAYAQHLPFQPLPDMKSTVLDGYWYVTGGIFSTVYCASLDLLIAGSESVPSQLRVWERLPNVPNLNSCLSAFTSQLLAIESDVPSSAVYAYSAEKRSWQVVCDMPIAMNCVATLTLTPEELVVIGDTDCYFASVSERVYPDESETFTLSELVAKHSLLFPIKVKVTKGFFGERGENSVIPVDEMYNMYFVKKAKVVTIRDSTRSKYIVPINSATKFGLIYKSRSFSDTHVFDTVADLLLASPLPKVVTALVAHQGPDEHTSIHRSEVLVIKGVHKPERLKTMFGKQQEHLKIFSFKTMQEKMLPQDAFCRFTVDPQYTQLYLPELLKYVDDPIPSSAKFFLDYDSGDPLPDLLVSGVVQLEKVEIETSIITSHVCDFEDEDERQFSDDDDDYDARLTERMVDIPISLDVEVSVLPPQDVSSHGDYEYGKLYDDAMTLVREFDPQNLSRFDGNEDLVHSYVTQNRFFSAVRKGHEKEGLDIVFPNMRKKTPLSSSRNSDEQRQSRFIKAMKKRIERKEDAIKVLENRVRQLKVEKEQLLSQLSPIHSAEFIDIDPAVWDLPGVEVCGELLVKVSSSYNHITWKDYGLKLLIQENSLPASVGYCTLNIKASLCGHYTFSENSSLVSAVFWIRCAPMCKFAKPIIVEFQHCAKTDKLSIGDMKFVRAACTQKQLPYAFKPLKRGTFSCSSSIGVIELRGFSGLAITQAGIVCERNYLAILLSKQDIAKRNSIVMNIYFVIICNTAAHHTAMRNHPRFVGAQLETDQPIVFESDQVEFHILEQNTKWTITGLNATVVRRQDVDSFIPRETSWIPYSHFRAKFHGDLSTVPDLEFKVDVVGAKSPHHKFTVDIIPEIKDSTSISHHSLSPPHSVQNNGTAVRLTRQHYPRLYSQLSIHGAQWRDVGTHLGFAQGELKNIQERAHLLANSPVSWLGEMLSQWLEWAPGDARGSVDFATLEGLRQALRQANLGSTAHDLRL